MTLHTHAATAAAPAVSHDGYIRLRLASLDQMPFIHLYSESDAGFLQELRGQDLPARCAGFSEWKSDTNPAISLGWGWFIDSNSDRLQVAPDEVRSNVMLVDQHGYDLGPHKTASLFGAWLNRFAWQPAVCTALSEATVAC
ncbi:MAG TPA: DUF4902 domain-containing protein [Noviherbaspirillum sp.]|uniref:DUF4902 domain-containing protein n=1 Tax=Noviherbaspirillum sp. TaxID=1926288 RepID=UPI002D233C2D|nr:DUF4902 domain-containing protein [Noviherbaspirillum sp.]HYD94468.1 DUF4902 domain-containing protein [Noviherbaspirillum sp.]